MAWTYRSRAEVERAIALAGWSTQDTWEPVLRDLLKERDVLYRTLRRLGKDLS